jgi:hypothetical protein
MSCMEINRGKDRPGGLNQRTVKLHLYSYIKPANDPIVRRSDSKSGIREPPRTPGTGHISANAARPLSNAVAWSLRRIARTIDFTCGIARAARS